MMFKTIDASDAKKSRDYVVRHYTEDVKDSDGNNKKRLLFRSEALYESSIEVSKKVPKLSEGDHTFIVLGTNFLENVYVWFNAEDHTVNMG